MLAHILEVGEKKEGSSTSLPPGDEAAYQENALNKRKVRSFWKRVVL